LKSSIPKKRSVISLDVGLKRIGLAYCDALHITVSILPAINRYKDYSEINILREYILKHRIEGIIIGLPLNDQGELTNQAKDCKEYGEIISGKLNLPFNFVNEHSSTWESINRFGLRKDKSGIVDSFSAKIILEQWILDGPELKE
tara:strand:+ start:51 stop:485 length:435 start_codon:yes stop_codon:yes gene_type:complete